MPALIPIKFGSSPEGTPKRPLVRGTSYAPPGSCVNSGHAAAFLARTSGLDATHITAYTNLLNGLDSDNLSCKLDVLHVYATQNSTVALLNLIQNLYNGTAHGAPTFTADRGFTGADASSTVYIDTGFDPTVAVLPNYLGQDCHMSVWQVNNAPSYGPALGSSTGTTLDDGLAAYIALRSTFPALSGWDAFASNQIFSSTLFGPIYVDSRGHFLQSRPDGTHAPIYRNGVADGRSSAGGTHVPDRKMYTLGGNFNGTAIGSPGQLAMISFGGFLDPTEITNFYGHLRTYMTAVGVP